jgi:hypothetical protein
MRGSVKDMSVSLGNDALTIREADWGEMHVALERYSQRLDAAPYLRGLPDDRCQCPHWGYVVSGEMHVRYADREETIRAGDAYFLAPGHAVIMEANTELVEFSPRAPHARTMEVVARNIEALQRQ